MNNRKRFKILDESYKTIKIFDNEADTIQFIEDLQNEKAENEYMEKHKEEIEKWKYENGDNFDPVYNSEEFEEEYVEPDTFYDYDEAKEWLEENTDYNIETYMEPKYVLKNDKYFCGVEIGEYGRKNGYVDYKTLASAFEGVLCNDIMSKTERAGLGYWMQVNGEEDESNYEKEIFQEIIVDNNGANILKDYTDEILYYNDELDMYVWCITHFGTAWSHVLTDIPIKPE